MAELEPLNADGVKLIDIFDGKHQLLISGYINKIKQELEALNDNTPAVIGFTCLLYYCVRERFTAHGKCMRINRDKDLASMVNVGGNTVYGSIEIKSNVKYVYRWNIKVVGTNYQWFAFSIGIDSSNKEHFESDFSVSGPYGNAHKFYAFGSDARGASGVKYTNICFCVCVSGLLLDFGIVDCIHTGGNHVVHVPLWRTHTMS
eukprot:305821_1